jgi:hypothetical protein
MARLTWGNVGERNFEAGIDRGVLYVPQGDGSLLGIPWNGLTGMDELSGDATTPHHLDGVKYMDSQSPGEFRGALRAFTYPDELETLVGAGNFGNGLLLDGQKPELFGFSYRTRVGSDVEGVDHGYQIHILFDIYAFSNPKTYQSTMGQDEAMEFAWDLIGKPAVVIPGFRPTSHIIIDSNEIDEDLLEILEDTLYGSSSAEPELTTMADFIDVATTFATIVITDNGDGTWTATGHDKFVHMLDATTFEITNVNATYLNANEYQVSTTFPVLDD